MEKEKERNLEAFEKDALENYYGEALSKSEYEQKILERDSEGKILRIRKENANLLNTIMSLERNFTKIISEKDEMESHYQETLKGYINERGEI